MTLANHSPYFPLLERVAASYGQAYFVYHVEGRRFPYLNPAFQQIWGMSQVPCLEAPERLLPAVHHEDLGFVKGQYRDLLGEGGKRTAEFRITLPGGETRWLCLSCELFKEESGTFIAGFAEDFTKRREYHHNILKFNAKKNATLEILSHDLAAPFTLIQGLAALLRMPGERNEEELLHALGLIESNAQRGSDMIRDFVNNEFLESSQVELHRERIDLVERIKTMMEDYEQNGGMVAKRFVTQVPGTPVYLYLDEMKFLQVMNNLISNAIKFTQDDGTITVKVEDQGSSAYLAVSDDGVGIPEAMHPILFDKFTKARRPGIRGEKSVGMGMSIIRNIVELHGGRIWFESQEGVGSTFHLEIPKQ
ncbi:ATP-binding protein [Rufibacter sediminis]|uniref:histidine kinase n=2 Tax=Rufibacter sediminis TaxID=2762756 RepID=A0ABR6VQZ5_9BACT|nr:PAS domain-containing sensor histidine kinase [Rufibacter sediminis]MBC3539001.1 PAS domain-containing sensor histidine kinase [Rufibacter sediminis]